ncbi:MAG: SGNH/GDSL hydrolase family protein [Clostridia bacterium]|nr:SGNH/GDSL hydrolase family protein [Clostridia bacterium]
MLFTILAIFLVMAIGACIFHVLYKVSEMPALSPKRFTPGQGHGKIVVCLGDSITQGAVSFNYVEALNEELKGQGFTFINAGVNSDVAYNALNRIQEIIGCNPDYVTILIGTNDANSTLDIKNEQELIILKKLPQKPTPEWFEENLTKLVLEIKKNTHAKIALLSIPVLGEDLQSEALIRTREYSGIIKRVAEREKVSYLPLNEKQIDFLEERHHTPLTPHDRAWLLPAQIAVMRYLFGTSWEKISQKKGLLLTVDTIHLNQTGAGMVVDLIKDFLTPDEALKDCSCEDRLIEGTDLNESHLQLAIPDQSDNQNEGWEPVFSQPSDALTFTQGQCED